VDKIELKDSERQPCSIYNRVVGYFRPVSSWNDSKQQEFNERAKLKVNYKSEDKSE
jgi:anaerobic ribonucleoside-triphosphate reductase